jgi:photosystem II stability/assembly factor-like uncharacterized protein
MNCRPCFRLLVVLCAACTAPSPGSERPDEAAEFPNAAAEWRIMRYLDERGQIPPRAWLTALQARQRTVAASGMVTMAGGVAPDAWVERGPNNVAGRSVSLVIDPRNPQRLIAGAVTGGLWVSTNGGATWSLVDDWWHNLSVGALTMDPANPDTLYVGTGEGFYSLAHPLRSFSHFVRGAGVLKSTDGGRTWTLLPGTIDWRAVTRIAVSPLDSRLVLVTRRPGGIARSTDGGQTWTDVAPADTSFQVAFDPNDGTKAIAHLAPASVQTHQVVTSIDAGLTWQPAASGLNAVTGENSRIELCYARSAPGVVYASVGGSGTVWRSADGGRNWVQRGSGTGTSYYYNTLWVDPTNESVLVVGALVVSRSSDGGQSFSQISNGYIMTVDPHSDVHAVVNDPGYDGGANRRVYVCTDGGLHVADDILAAAQGAGWRDLDVGMRSTQFYGAAGHMTGDVVVGGTQDNGTLRVRGASQTANLTFGGDGGQVQIDPTNANYVYGEYQFLGVHRSTNGGTSSTQITSGLSDNGSSTNANFIAPLRLDPNDPQRLYAGGARLWRTTSARGTVTWTSIKATVGSLISSIAITPGAADRIYVGHNDGRLYRTLNGTAAAPTWLALDDNGASNPLPNRVVTRLVVDPGNTATVYATFGGFAADNLWRSTDSGVTWQRVAGTAPLALPPAPVYGMAVHPDDGNVLYAATEVGLFTSDDGGAHWSASNQGPANVVCEEVTFMHGSRRLVLATLGRGLWTADVLRSAATGFGSACAGHATPPAIAVDPLATARIGQTVGVLGQSLRIGQPLAVLLVGFSNSSWNSVPLPFDLTPAGLNGCPLLVSLDLLLATTIGAGGTAGWSLTLPNDRALLGGRLYAQAMAPDPGLNPAGFAVSAGLQLTLGW